MVDDSKRQANDEIEITPEAFEAFEDVFEEWKQNGRNVEILELGGSGDLKDLAQRCWAWVHGAQGG